MGRFFVTPESVKLELPKCGSWVLVKKELNRAEHDTVIGAGVNSFRRTESETDFQIDSGAMNITKIHTWVIEWGLTAETPTRGEDGQAKLIERPVPVSMQSITNLTVDVSTEILEVIEAHQAALEQEKKATNTMRLAR